MSIEKITTSNERIRDLLHDLRMSQIEFCNKTGIKPSALSNYLKKNRIPRQDALLKIADAFKVSPAWLMGYDVPKEMITPSNVTTVFIDGDQGRESIQVFGSPERINLYMDMFEAAYYCDEDQIKIVIETLKAMAKGNRKELGHDPF